MIQPTDARSALLALHCPSATHIANPPGFDASASASARRLSSASSRAHGPPFPQFTSLTIHASYRINIPLFSPPFRGTIPVARRERHSSLRNIDIRIANLHDVGQRIAAAAAARSSPPVAAATPARPTTASHPAARVRALGDLISLYLSHLITSHLVAQQSS